MEIGMFLFQLGNSLRKKVVLKVKNIQKKSPLIKKSAFNKLKKKKKKKFKNLNKIMSMTSHHLPDFSKHNKKSNTR